MRHDKLTPPMFGGQPLNFASSLDSTEMYRRDDPATSKEAAKRAAFRVGSQLSVLLEAFVRAGQRGLTSEEAGIETKLAERRGCCYWRRVTDLAKLGLLRDSNETRTASTGDAQAVRVISERGMAAWQEFLRTSGRLNDAALKPIERARAEDGQ